LDLTGRATPILLGVATNYKVDSERLSLFRKKYLKAAVALGELVQGSLRVLQASSYEVGEGNSSYHTSSRSVLVVHQDQGRRNKIQLRQRKPDHPESCCEDCEEGGITS
jgi:hypothetical protein